MIRVQATVDAKDLDRVVEALDKHTLEQVLITAFKDALQPVVNLARTMAPRGKTGKLARGIEVRVRQRGGLKVSIWSRAPYGHLVEYGHRLVTGGQVTRLNRGTGKRAVLKMVNGVLTGKRGGRYTGRVIGFVVPHAFVRPAFEQVNPDVNALLVKAVEAHIDHAGGRAVV